MASLSNSRAVPPKKKHRKLEHGNAPRGPMDRFVVRGAPPPLPRSASSSPPRKVEAEAEEEEDNDDDGEEEEEEEEKGAAAAGGQGGAPRPCDGCYTVVLDWDDEPEDLEICPRCDYACCSSCAVHRSKGRCRCRGRARQVHHPASTKRRRGASSNDDDECAHGHTSNWKCVLCGIDIPAGSRGRDGYLLVGHYGNNIGTRAARKSMPRRAFIVGSGGGGGEAEVNEQSAKEERN